MRCPACGAKAPAGAKFCPTCGAAIPVQPGGVHTGGGAYVGGSVHAGGDFIGRDQIVDRSGLHVLTSATGAAKVLISAGVLLSFAGFALFGFGIVSFMLQVFGMAQASRYTPPDFAVLARWVPIGFGVMIVGIVIGNIGLLMYRRR